MLTEIENLFRETIRGKEGIIGACPYDAVLDSLMPVQQNVLSSIGTGESLIVFGIFHSPRALSLINRKKDGKTDYAAWNVYAREYHQLNALLNRAAETIAEYVKGIPIPATTQRVASTINRVEDYYTESVSHRVGAELAGLGWRGKNELIVTREKGCAVRFASVICPSPLEYGTKMDNNCHDCTACLDVCSILRKKTILKNYREQCRRFMVRLNLEGDVCGKCVKACYLHWTSTNHQ
jgi:epoxyqueuosine reductase QueG